MWTLLHVRSTCVHSVDTARTHAALISLYWLSLPKREQRSSPVPSPGPRPKSTGVRKQWQSSVQRMTGLQTLLRPQAAPSLRW